MPRERILIGDLPQYRGTKYTEEADIGLNEAGVDAAIAFFNAGPAHPCTIRGEKTILRSKPTVEETVRTW